MISMGGTLVSHCHDSKPLTKPPLSARFTTPTVPRGTQRSRFVPDSASALAEQINGVVAGATLVISHARPLRVQSKPVGSERPKPLL